MASVSCDETLESEREHGKNTGRPKQAAQQGKRGSIGPACAGSRQPPYTMLADGLESAGVAKRADMTKAVKVKVLFAILTCAPMGRSKEQFAAYAKAGDLEGFWTYYQRAMATRSDIKRGVESSGEVSFEMLRPAMEAIYRLPVRQ